MWSILVFSFLLLFSKYFFFSLIKFSIIIFFLVNKLKNKYLFFLGKGFIADKVKRTFFLLTVLIIFLTFIIENRFELKILCFSLLIFFFTKNLIFLYIFFELSIIPAFFLIFKKGKNPERINALAFLLIYTIIGSVPLIFCFLFKYKKFSKIQKIFLFSKNVIIWNNLKNFFGFFLIFSFLIKLPLFGFHKWLPKAHVEAPTTGSMILAALLLKMGSFGLYRFKISRVLNKFSKVLAGWILFSLIFVRGICFLISDLKMLIAFSSINHMLLVAFRWTYLSFKRLKFSVLLRVSHGFIRRGLFLIIGFLYKNSRSRKAFFKKGLKILFSIVSFMFFFLLMLKCSAPTSLSLFSEIFLFRHLENKIFSYFRVIFFVFFSGLYCIYLYMLSFHGKIDKKFSKKIKRLFLYMLSSFLHVIISVFLFIFLINFI